MKRFYFFVALCFFHAASFAQSEDPWKSSYELEAAGRFQEAIAVLQALSATQSQNDFFWMRRAWLAYRYATYNESIENYKRAIELNPNSIDAYAGIMLPLMAQTRWREAISYAQSGLKISPLQYYLNVRLMACEEATQQWQALLDHAQSFAKYYSGDVDTWIFVGRAASVLGKKTTAVSAYRKVLEIYPGQIEAVRFLASQ